MARTVSTIKAEIVAHLATQAALSGLTSPSQTAIWNLWAYVIAVIMNLQEQIFDLFRAEVDNTIANSRPGTVPWYHSESLAFQYGDSLEYIDRRFVYSVIDESKQIIKRVAVKEVYDQVRIYISKVSNNIPCKLSPAEEVSFTYYINKVKFAGTNIAVINYDPDLIRLDLDVNYDPLVMNPDGSLIRDSGVFPVNDAVDAYLTGITYGGTFNITRLIDAIQNATGVLDPILNSAEGKANSATTWNTIAHEYEAIAGYMIIDTITANYIPHV